jgi:hypothetical protein
MGKIVWENHNFYGKIIILWFFNKKGECFFLFILTKNQEYDRQIQ